jgi:hypothetical protein
LPAIAMCQSPFVLTGPPPSRASPLPQWFVALAKLLHGLDITLINLPVHPALPTPRLGPFQKR